MNRRLAAVLGAAALAGLVVGLVVLLRDEPAKRRPSGLLDPPAQVDAVRQELLGLLGRGRGSTYHATYEGSGSTGLPARLEVWRRGTLLRADTQTKQGSKTIRTAAFSLASGSQACTRVDEGAWSCRAAQAPPGPDRLADDVTADLARTSVEVAAGTVRERPVRCFTLAGPERARLCLTGEGVLALIEAAGSRLELVALDPAVPDDVFTLPA